MAERPWLIYGAYGYTGELVAREAVARGLCPILAGRREGALRPLAEKLELEWRAVALDRPGELTASLADVALVLHCAGPFVRTSRPMVEACLAAGAHYLDITGEIAVFEAAQRQSDRAKAAVVLLPGVGFDVVPSDCLAARLAEALPSAEQLVLAFTSLGGGTSRGTLKTMIEGLPASGAVRRGGKIVPVPLAWDAREIPFACGSRWAVTIPWGDVSTAFHTTGIPDIRVYTGAPRRTIRRMRRLAPLLPLLGAGPVKRLLQWWIGKTVTGPDAAAREAGRVHLWGETRAADGASRTATLETPEGYSFTAVAAVECARRVLAGEVTPGAWTPARAFGARFVDGLPGVVAGQVSE